MVRHKTPEWMDEVFEREEIGPDEYYDSFGIDRKGFWRDYWQPFGTEEYTPPEAIPETPSVFEWLTDRLNALIGWLFR